MKHRCLSCICLAIALLFADAHAAFAAGPLRVRVLTYNIHHGEGVDGKLDLKRIAAVIQSVSPDIVALQEVDRKVRRTGGVDQPKVLAGMTKLHVVFGGNISLQGGAYGNAVLSRWPIGKHENHKLPNYDDGEQRGLLKTEIKPGDGNPSFLLLATHLDHRRKDRERFDSAGFISKLIANHDKTPAILAGDLNATPDSRVLKEFGKSWRRANEKILPTIPVSKPTRQIDFILFRPANRWKVIEVRVLKEAVASDHRAVFAVLELQP